ncbi:MAG: hypothetical protein QM831_32135 [Kofleriaceae bacterium]
MLRRVAATCVLMARVAAADPEAEALAHLDHGIAAYRIADYPTARKELDAAIELVPDRANPYRWRALTEAAQHDCVNALVDIESFLSRAPAGDERIPEMTQLRDHCVARATVASPPPPPPESHPVYTRWWFWTAIGVVVAGGIAITIAATHHSENTLPTVHL